MNNKKFTCTSCSKQVDSKVNNLNKQQDIYYYDLTVMIAVLFSFSELFVDKACKIPERIE